MLDGGGIDPCGSCSRPPSTLDMYILVTLCRFDSFIGLRSFMGPFIPCERRLAISGFLEIQGRGLWTGF